jgi:Fe-Mn family superoxide dismutase
MSQNAAQVYNHDFFWKCISEEDGNEPGEKLRKELRKYFGSYDTFIDKFSQAALTLFGSGWVWLAMNKDDSLEILQLPNSGTPITLDKKPLLCIDVWEHSYYIDYRNDRAKYIEAFMQAVDWEFVSSNL